MNNILFFINVFFICRPLRRSESRLSEQGAPSTGTVAIITQATVDTAAAKRCTAGGLRNGFQWAPHACRPHCDRAPSPGGHLDCFTLAGGEKRKRGAGDGGAAARGRHLTEQMIPPPGDPLFERALVERPGLGTQRAAECSPLVQRLPNEKDVPASPRSSFAFSRTPNALVCFPSCARRLIGAPVPGET